MPQIDANRNASRQAVKKVVRKRKPAPKPKPPTKAVVKRARAQQQQYVSQGKAVEKTANSQRKERQSRAQEQEHVSQGKAVENAANEQRRDARIKYLRRTRKHITPASFVRAAVRAASLSGEAGPRVVNRHGLPGATAEQAHHASPLGAAVSRGVSGMSKAIIKDPAGVSAKTAKGLEESLAGIPAAVVKMTVDTAKGTADGDPLRGVKNAAKGYAKDASRRYGPLTKPGGEKEFSKRIQKEGAAGEVLDIAGAATGVGGTAGKVAGAAARAGKLGKKAEKVATERPKLRVSGGEAKTQKPSENLIVAGAQAVHDSARRRKSARKVQHAEKHGHAADVLDVERKTDEVVPLRRGTVTGGARRQQAKRVAVRKGHALEQMRREQAREVHRGTNRNIARLSGPERKALKHAIQLGVRDPETARRVLSKRIASIEAERDGKTVPRVLRKTNDELPALRKLVENADQAFTAKVGRVADVERRRGKRLAQGDPALSGERSMLRAYAQQAETLGIKRGERNLTAPERKAQIAQLEELIVAIEKKANRQRESGRYEFGAGNEKNLEKMLKGMRSQLADLRAGKGGVVEKESAAAFVSRVRQAAKKEGLADPGYFTSQKRPTVRHSNFAVGGTRAIADDKRYTGTLFREGREDMRPEVLGQGFAKNIKRKHNWNMVADTVDAEAFDWSKGKTIEQIRDELDRRGIDPESVALWAPGRFRKHAEGAASPVDAGDEVTLQDLGRAVDDASATFHPDGRLNAPEGFEKSSGFVLIPSGVHKELTADTRPSGKVARGYEVVKGKQSRLLLGTSPKWLQVQVASNALLTGLAGVGPVDVAKAQVWWRGLSQAERDAVEPYIGVGHFQDSVRQPKIGGAANGKLINAYRAFKQTPFWSRPRKALRGGTFSDLNPLDILFRIDNAQNNAFRKAVLYNAAKRQAYKDMGQNAGRFMERQRHLSGLLTLGPKDQIRAVIRDKDKLEQSAQAVNDFLGDYLTYTASERRVLGRSVMFYGFLRFSLRFTFWTMPTKHPLVSAITAQLGRLEVDELRKLMGGDSLPYGLGKFYYRSDGKLKSIDLSSANPTANLITSLKAPKDLIGFVPPMISSAINIAVGKNVFLDRPLLVEGEDKGRRSADYLKDIPRIGARDALELLAPYREWEKAATGGRPQGDDSLFGDRPTVFTDKDKQLGVERDAARNLADGSTLERAARGLTPFIPKTEKIDQQAKLAQAYKRLEQIDKRKTTIKRTDDGYFYSKEYEALLDEEKKLRARVNELQARGTPAPRATTKRLSRRPLPYDQQLKQRVDERLKRYEDYGAYLERKYGREAAKLKIQSGG